MRKYQTILILISTILYLLWLYFSYASLFKTKRVYLKDLNTTVIDMHQVLTIPLETIHSTSFRHWGVERNKLLEKRESQKSKKEKSMVSPLNKKLKLTNRVICLDKKCWEFMGIVTTGSKVTVSLLSRGKKPKLGTFTIGDNLLENLTIIDIKGDNMMLLDTKKEKRFILKLFEVNASKYYPKEIKNQKELNE